MNAPRSARIRQFMADWDRALGRLEEVLSRPYGEDNRAIATLQFVLVYELCWKSLMFILSEEGIETSTPRSAFSQAYQQSWLRDERLWLDLIRDRNLVAHTYSERTAMAVFEDIRRSAPELRRAHTFLKEEFGTRLGE